MKKTSDLEKVKRFFKRHKMPFEEGQNMFGTKKKKSALVHDIIYLPYLYVNFDKKGKATKPF